MKSTALVLSLLLPYVAQTQPVVQTLPVVDLGYSIYQGITQNGINKWLGMRFAAPPTGNFRWRAPALPLATTGVQLATTVSFPSPIDPNCETRLILRCQPGPTCLSVGGSSAGESEDCLFVNVYAPVTATAKSKLPVWVFIQGGGFGDDASPNIDGTQIITNSGDNIIFVNFNYRVGIWGFLASSEIMANGNANAGLFDQLAALQWVQANIAKVGPIRW
jgi:acetylcholinesterase